MVDALKPPAPAPAQSGALAATAGAPPVELRGAAFRSGVAISLTNPWAVGYWMSIGGAMVGAGVAGDSPAHTAAFVGGYAAGVTAYGLAVAACFRWLSRFLDPGSVAARAVIGLCGLTLVGLAVALGWQVFAASGGL
jgi:threonine/homoserine/homoserine lactone efflux protein